MFKARLSPVPGLITIILFFLLGDVAMFSCTDRPATPGVSTTAETQKRETNNKPLRKVRLLPYWVPSAQFAGYYMGIEKGIFRKHGLDLEILPFDPVMPVDEVIKDKKTDFALLWMVNAIEIRDKGVEIVDIAQFSSRSSLMLITRKSSGINEIGDMNGKRAGIWLGYEMQPQALFRKYHLDVKVVSIGSTNNLFLRGTVDILNANWYDEYHSLLNNGINEDELNNFFFADYGLNFLEDGMYCLAETVRKDPELCREFINATVESWNYAFDHQEETIEVIEKYARKHNQPFNQAHQQWMLSHYRTMYIPAGRKDINTWLQQKDYENIQRIMMESHFITHVTPYREFFQPCNNPGQTR